jgi:hypothetical protein
MLQLINKASNVGRWVKKHRSTHGIFDEMDEQIVKKLAAHVSTLLAKRNLQRQNQVRCCGQRCECNHYEYLHLEMREQS